MQDDNLSPITRGLALALVPFLVSAGALLYFWPLRTTELFAWTITPAMTALLMGAGYFSGAYFFLRAAASRQWSTVATGFPPITAFTWLSALATILHWDRFNHAHPTFYIWVGVYAVTPFLVPGLWAINRRLRAPVDPPANPVWPFALRLGLGLAGLGLIGLGMLLFIYPEGIIPYWPWALTPLTARVVGSWFVLAGWTDISLARAWHWDHIKVVMESQIIGLSLITLGLLRALGDLNPGSPGSTVYITGIALLAVILFGIYLRTAARQRPAR